MNSPVVMRTRGRPPQSEADLDAMKTRIIEGTLQAFAENGSHKLRVEHVLEKAGVSRPTFYKYFRTLDEPLQIATRTINDDLIHSVRDAMLGHDNPGNVVAVALAGVNAYMAWGRRLGPVLQPLYTELYDPQSPIAELRLKTINGIHRLIAGAIRHAGRPEPRPIQVESFIIGVEYLVYRYLLRTAQTPEDTVELHQALLRTLVMSFGNAADLQAYAALWPTG